MVKQFLDKTDFEQNSDGYYDYSQNQLMRQDYTGYTANDYAVWKILYNRQIGNLPQKATQAYMDGIEIVEFKADKIPNFEEINHLLQPITGWKIQVVPGLIPNKTFFELMRDKNFCATTWLRHIDQLDYLEEPDMFHDVFGHVPLLTNHNLCDFLVQLSTIALKYIDNEEVIEAVARLYWYTIEFGLIQEEAGLRIYGAGILSSSGETDYALLSPEPQRVSYDVEKIIQTPYIKDRFQDIYFVIPSFEALFLSINEVADCIERIANKQMFIQ